MATLENLLIKVGIDPSEVSKGAAKAASDAEKGLAKADATIRPTVDDSTARSGIAGVVAMAESRIDQTDAAIMPIVDDGMARSGIADVVAMAETQAKAADATVKPTINATAARSQIANVVSHAESAAKAADPTITPDVDQSGVGSAIADVISRAESMVRGASVEITPTVDEGRARSQIAGVVSNAESKAKGASVTITPEIDESKAEGDMDGLMGSLKDKAKGGAAAAGLVAAAAFWDSISSEASLDKVAAQLGLGPNQMEKISKVASNIFANNWSSSVEEAGQGIAAVISSLPKMRIAGAEELERLSSKALAFADIMEVDVTRATNIIGQLIRNDLVRDADHGFDLIMASSQRVPAEIKEDLLDAADEYGKHFATLGISGKNMFELLVRGAQDGMYGIDKTGDAIKELTVFTAAGGDAMETAFANVGLDGSKMADMIAEGGAKGGKALDMIVDALRAIKDPGDQAQAAIALFGVPLEDLGAHKVPGFLKALDGMSNKLGEVPGTMDRAMIQASDNMEGNLKTIANRARLGAQDIVAGFLSGDWDRVGKGITQVWEGVKLLFQKYWRQILVIASVGIGLLVLTIIDHWDKITGFFKKTWDKITGFFKDGWDKVKDVTGGAVGWVRDKISDGWDKVRDLTSNVWNKVKDVIGNVWDKIRDTVSNAVNRVKDLVSNAWDKVKDLTSNAWNKVRDVISNVWDRIKELASNAATRVREIVSNAWDRVREATINAWNRVRDVISNVWDRIREIAVNAADRVRDVVVNAWDRVRDATSNVWSRIREIIGNAWEGIKNIFGNLKDGVRAILDVFQNVKEGIANVWGRIKDIVLRPVGAVLRILETLADAFDSVSGKIGGPTIGYNAPKWAGAAKGAVIPGYTPGRDIGVIGVSGGESIMRPEWTRAVGADRVMAMNRMAQAGGVRAVRHYMGEDQARQAGYAKGGTVPYLGGFAGGGRVWPVGKGNWTNYGGKHDGIDFPRPRGTPIHAAAAGRTSYKGWDRGYGLAVFEKGPYGELVYGHMASTSTKKGESLSAGDVIGYVDSTGNSTGNHLHFGFPGGDPSAALAFLQGASVSNIGDIGGDTGGGSALDFLSSLPGFVQDAVSNPTDYLTGKIEGAMGNLPGGYLGSFLKAFPKALIGALADKIKSVFDGAAGQWGGITGIQGGAAMSIVKAVADSRGWDEGKQWNALVQLVQAESSWRPNAQNPTSSAYGLFQFLDSTWATVGGYKTADPEMQAIFGLRYIAQKYGTPVKAWNFHQNNGWYDNGGILPPGVTMAVNNTGQDEYVLNRQQMGAALGGGGRVVGLLERIAVAVEGGAKVMIDGRVVAGEVTRHQQLAARGQRVAAGTAGWTA